MKFPLCRCKIARISIVLTFILCLSSPFVVLAEDFEMLRKRMVAEQIENRGGKDRPENPDRLHGYKIY